MCKLTDYVGTVPRCMKILQKRQRDQRCVSEWSGGGRTTRLLRQSWVSTIARYMLTMEEEASRCSNAQASTVVRSSTWIEPRRPNVPDSQLSSAHHLHHYFARRRCTSIQCDIGIFTVTMFVCTAYSQSRCADYGKEMYDLERKERPPGNKQRNCVRQQPSYGGLVDQIAVSSRMLGKKFASRSTFLAGEMGRPA